MNFRILVFLLSLLLSPSLFAAAVITNASASATDTQFTISYQVTKPQSYYRVYIDTDQNAQTGFSQGGIGANYLIEGSGLYAYVGPGWKWSLVKTITFQQSSNTVNWVLNRADINSTNSMNCAGTLSYLDQVEANSVISSSAKMNVAYPANANCGGTNPPVPPTPPTNSTQKLAIPSYFYPCTSGTSCYWTQLNQGAPKVGLAIINPNNGVGTSSDANYVKQTNSTKAAGAIVLGYVATNYGNRNAAQIQTEIDRYYSWYNVDGIFFDEGYSSDCNKVSYYQNLNNYVKAKGGKAITSVNFGTLAPECYAAATDILVTFESDFGAYQNWRASGWESKYPASRFWHLVYNTPQGSLQTAMQLSQQRNVGWMYVTPDNLPNPWDTLPTGAYWTSELNLLK